MGALAAAGTLKSTTPHQHTWPTSIMWFKWSGHLRIITRWVQQYVCAAIAREHLIGRAAAGECDRA